MNQSSRHRRIYSFFITILIMYPCILKKDFRNLTRSVSNSLSNFSLQSLCKLIIALTCNYSKHINIMNICTKRILIHTITIFIYAKTHTTTNFLTLTNFAAALLQSTNLEYIWIIPTFSKCRVRENKSYR